MLMLDNPRVIEADLFSLDAGVSVLDDDQIGVLREAMDDAGPEFFQEIIDTFREECLPRIEQVASTAAAQDNAELRKHIHFIAGSAANTGFLRLAELCRRVEEQIDGKSFKAYAEVPDLVRYEFECAMSEVTKAA